jgi:hypothetical protein
MVLPVDQRDALQMLAGSPDAVLISYLDTCHQ